jgi:hypothetical protein
MRATLEQENRLAHGTPEVRRRIFDQLAANPWVSMSARLGYAANGLLYVIFGGTAALAAVNIGGRVRGTQGALKLLVAQPFGRLAVSLVAIGLCGFILRRLVQIFVPPTDGVPPKPVMRALRRTGCALSGLMHIGIALTALQLTVGLIQINPDAQTPKPGWVTLLLTWNLLDGWFTLFAGLIVLAVAVYEFYIAIYLRFTIDLQLERMSTRMKRATFACGVAGHTGRGTAFLIIGMFLVYAGYYVEEVEATGIGDLLRSLEVLPFGVWILIVTAAGLIAYGLFLLLAAWYLRMLGAW